ncbi:hypothetical protein [Bacillus massiliglaciei]|uniref:hypothetical protein n=1 Tax=Bacillus massiliglaciei TaxID=1816693 RepID=UPI001F2862D0|nr:hypothetical protein [Bacillus massiliglaciei]
MYTKKYQVTFPIEVNLIVGGFGSNAYTHRQIIPNITFALEKLSPRQDHLRTIAAHEFGHVTHNTLSHEAGTDWEKIDWYSPLIWLLQEGAAIHLSRQIVTDLTPSMYFSFDDEGKDWLTFSESNTDKIKAAFAWDITNKSTHYVYREWFSINGGERYGYSRLGYYLADLFFQSLIRDGGEQQAMIAWKNREYEKKAKEWLFLNTAPSFFLK